MNGHNETDPTAPEELPEVVVEFVDDTRARVAVVSLNRPEQLNPISGRPGGTRDQILAAFELAGSTPDVGCVVLRGNGRAFSGGGDLTGNARRETLEQHREFLETVDAFHERVRASRIPVIAEVHGFCLGAGLVLAHSCDLVIASEGARFGFPEGRLGLVGIAPLVSTVGRQWAKYLMLTGEIIDAGKALELGLVLSVEPDDELHERTLDLAFRIARMPRSGVASNRRTIDAVADAGGDTESRRVSLDFDALTLNESDQATAPDGRTFRHIIDTEGLAGMKRARAEQYTTNWLR